MTAAEQIALLRDALKNSAEVIDRMSYCRDGCDCYPCSTRDAADAALAATAAQPVPAADVPNAGPWHDWSGGECPVAGEVWVDVKFRKGESLRTDESFVFDWWHNSRGGDIIAWRYAAVTPAPAIQVQGPTQDTFGFLDAVFNCAFEAVNLDGADIQEMGVKYGLLKKVQATEPCREDCDCASVTDFPTECYRTTYLATPQPEQTADLHGAVMNIPSESEARICGLDTAGLYAYKLGHRDARHAAAELVAQQSNALALTGEQILDVVFSMPGGIEGHYRQKWGLVAFARAILLAAQGGKP